MTEPFDTERVAASNRRAHLAQKFITEAGQWHHQNLAGELARNSNTLDQHACAALGTTPLDILDAYADAGETLLGHITGIRKLIEYLTDGPTR